jgi:hypothetical protein
MKTQTITTVELDNAKQSIIAEREEARQVLAAEAADAKKAINAAATEAVKVLGTQNKGDHDFLLIFSTEVKGKLDGLIKSVQDLANGTAARLDRVEARTLIIEKCHEEIDPHKIAKIAYDGLAWRKQYDVVWKITLALITLASIIVGIILGAEKIIKF